MAADNQIEVDLLGVDQGVAAEMEKVTAAMRQVLGVAQQVQQTFINTSNAIGLLPGKIRDLNKELKAAEKAGDSLAVEQTKTMLKEARQNLKLFTDEVEQSRRNLQIKSEGRAVGREAQLATTVDGRTLGESQARNQTVNLLTTSINTSEAQMAARIADAAGKAAERLIKTAEASIVARFNQVGVNEQIRRETFGSAVNTQAMLTRARIGTEKMVRDYGPEAPQTLAAQDAAKEAAATARRVALRERENATIENKDRDSELRRLALRERAEAESDNKAFDASRKRVGLRERETADIENKDREKASRIAALRERAAADEENRERDRNSKSAAVRERAAAEDENRILDRANRTLALRQRTSADADNKEFDARLKRQALNLRAEAEQENRNFDERQRSTVRNMRSVADGENRRLTPETAARMASRDTAFANKYGTERDDFARRIKEENLSIEQQRVLLRGLADDQIKLNAAKRNAPKPAQTPEEARAARQVRQQANNEALDDRLSDNGGATFFGFQARIAANYAIFGAAVTAIRSAATAIVEFDDVLSKFRAITDTTNTEMVTFRSQLLGIASDSKFSVTEIGQVAIALGQTGLASAEVAKALRPVIDLATASGSTLQDAVEAVTGVLGAYAMEAGRAGDVSDVFVGALNRTKLTMGQLQLGIQYAANIARDSGVSFSELTATIGSISQAGVKSGSTIGTGVRQLLTELSSPTEKFRNVLKELGISLADVDLKTNGLTGVLENLRNKGFTTADALRSLDLRAAAAFSALAGQGNRVKTLQQELLLSSAAADASTKANESLASGFQRFQNSAFAVVDKALAPMVEALKGAVGGVASLFQGLQQLGPLLPVVGTGLAALAAAATALKLGSLVAGLASGVSVASLGAALPVAAVASAIVAGGALVNYLELLDDKAERATKRLDQLKAASNDITGQISSVETNTTAINAQILQLIDRREKLNADPVLRRTAVIEAQKAFGELGLTISSSISNIDDLVEALQRLRTGLNTKGPNLMLEQLQLLRAETQQLLILQEEQAKKSRATYENSGGDVLGSEVRPLQKFDRFKGETFDRARSVITDPTQLGADALQQAGAIYGGLGRELSAAMSARAAAVLANNTKEVAAQDQRINLLLELNGLVKQAVDTQNNINAKNMQIERTTQSIAAAGITNRPEIDTIVKNIEGIYGQRDRAQGTILNDKGATDLEKRDRLAESLSNARMAGDLQLTILNDMAETMKNEGVPPAVIEEALAPIRNKIADVSKGVSEPLRQIFDSVSVGAKSILESQKRGIQLQIDNALKGAGTARDPVSIQAAEEEVKALVERQSKLIVELAKLQVVNPEELESNQQVRSKMAEDQENLRTQMLGYMEKISAAKRRVTEQLLEYRDIGDNAQKERLTKEAARLQKILDDANTTPEKARELVEQINRLLTEAANIAKRMNLTEVERKAITAPSETGTAIPGAGAADGSVAKQIIDASNANGADAGMTRYLLALAQLESSQDPTRKNASGATGLLQFMNSERTPTWRNSGGGDIYSVQDQIRNGITFTNQNDEAFRKAMGRDPTGEERFVLHNQGSGGGLGLLRNPGSRATDQVSSAAVTGNAGSTSMTSAEFVEVLKGMYRAAYGKTEGQATSAKTILDEGRKDKDAAVDEGVKQAEEKGRKRIAEIERNNELVRLKVLDREDAARLQGEESLVRRALTPSDAMAANAKALQTLAELRGNALTRDDVQNRGRPDAQKVEDQSGIDAAFRQRAETQAIAAAEAVGKVTLKVYDDQLEQAQNRIKDLKRDSSDGKFNAEELNSLNQQVEALQKKKELQGQLESYDASIASLNQSLNQIQESGLGSRKDLLRITEQLAALEAKRKALAPGVERSAALDKSAPSLDNALSLGTDDFLKSRGITNNLGELVSSTQQARKMLAADLNVIAGGFDSLFTNLFNGSMKAGDALKKFATDILSGLLSQASKALTNSLFAGIFGGKGGEGGGAGGIFSAISSALGIGGAANGGMQLAVPGMAGGGEVSGGIPGRDSVLRKLMPGEFVLRRSAVEGVGRENLEAMNAMGNRMVSNAPKMSVAGLGGGSTARATSNVYVVSPEQKPPPSQRDIVYMVSEDIQTGGQLRKLIKSVVAGHE